MDSAQMDLDLHSLSKSFFKRLNWMKNIRQHLLAVAL